MQVSNTINHIKDLSLSPQQIHQTLKSLRKGYRSFIKYRIRSPIRYRFDLTTSHIKKIGIPLTQSNRLIRALIVTEGKFYASEAQFDPLFAYRKALKQRFGFISKLMYLKDALRHPQLFSQFDVIIVKLPFTYSTEEATQVIESIYAAKGSAKLIYFDGDDDLCVQWPEIFSYIDLYVKFYIFSDLDQYSKIFIGKSNLTDYVASHYGYSFANSAVPMSKPLDSGYRSRLFLGDNYASNNMLKKLYHSKLLQNQRISKTTDIICSLSLTHSLIPSAWKKFLRQDAVIKLKTFSSRYGVHVNTGKKIPHNAYYSKMLTSKICVSPFGNGELTYRDFEAVLCRCLLVKPDMSHLQTTPNIFIPYESYVPVKWDYSDLEEKCIYYLEHDEEREKIVQRAYQILSDYYRNDSFLDNFAQLLKRIDLI